MPEKALLLLLMVISLNCCIENGNNNQPLAIYDQVEGFVMPVVIEPAFQNNTANIADFGAISDGQTLNTKAIADAISQVSEKGGGRVIIPRGLWLTGPIILKSNIDLHAEDGALVIFSSDKNLYPLIETVFEGVNTVRCTSPISGRDLENIALTGKGVYNGTGEAWRPVKKVKMTESQWKKLIASGGVVSEDNNIWYPSQSYLDGEIRSNMNVPAPRASLKDYEDIRDFLRPVMVSLINCKKVLLDGPVFQNSPAWCLHPLMCEDLTIRNITVKNPWYSQNGDGLDIESCRNILVYDSNFDVGDDAICIKSGKDEAGRLRGRPTENLLVSNCIVYNGHGGVTVGSEMSGGVKNVSVKDCTFIGTDVGLRFKSNRGRGGVVENIFLSDIDMINIPTQAISFDLYYGGLSVSEMPENGNNNKIGAEMVPIVTVETPVFKNITIRNLTCKGAQHAIFLQGLPEQNLENITLENINIEADKGMTCIDASGVTIKGMRLITKDPAIMTIINSRNIDIQMLDIPEGEQYFIDLKGKRSSDINIRSVNKGQKIKAVISDEADNTTIKIL